METVAWNFDVVRRYSIRVTKEELLELRKEFGKKLTPKQASEILEQQLLTIADTESYSVEIKPTIVEKKPKRKVRRKFY